VSAYTDWIEANYPTPESARNQCHMATAQMVEKFPELWRRRGYYIDVLWGRRHHWWCVDPQGAIVDPTAHQFPGCGQGDYEALDESAVMPIGKCLECGGLVYESQGHSDPQFCNAKCRAAFARSLTG